MAKKVTSSSSNQPDPLTKTLLEDNENNGKTGGVGMKTDHSRAIERDNLIQHSHSHGNGEHHHGHSHDEKHAHDEKHDKTKTTEEENDDDFVEMWNHTAPAGPEHGGPRGLEPTRYSNEWEKNGRVKDFTV